ncbi:hypothetical protein LQF12_16280 [Ruania suaedae]|uniref:hypothetical protein n=1 Tax=Ruania suaedae TaxID=2897774 RepID=UPI001E4578AA|nr:hypothetical protein [Ruania suaedae]UFU03018.1 hypothetical protein LQF12_16280 [Ruania suaedae]
MDLIPRPCPARAAPMARAVCAVLTAGVLLVAAGSAASAAAGPEREEIVGDVLRLVSVQDRAAMRSMEPGESVPWDVQVSANEPEGSIDLSLVAVQAEGGFTVSVAACEAEASGCGRAVLDRVPVTGGSSLEIATQAAAEAIWYRVSVQLSEEATAPASTTLRLLAEGAGDEISTDGEVGLPTTGASLLWPAVLALGAVLLGAAIAVVARRRLR